MEIFICLLLAALFLCGVVVGVIAAEDSSGESSDGLSTREAKVRIEMDALRRTQQLNMAYLAARQTMWEEALRHQRRTR